MRQRLLAALVACLPFVGFAQPRPVGMAQVNGLSEPSSGVTAIRGARLWLSPDKTIDNGLLLIQNGRVLYAGADKALPQGTYLLEAKGRTVYPAFIEPISELGLPQPPPPGGEGGSKPPQYGRTAAGQGYWNEHIRPEQAAAALFKYDEAGAAALRKLGFGYALSHVRDGIARGTGAFVALRPEKANQFYPVLKAEAASFYALARSRRSEQQYPGSLMGALALLRQAFADAAAYTGAPANTGLAALKAQGSLPAILEAGHRLNLARAVQLSRETGRRFILRGQGDQYRRLDDLKADRPDLIVPIPQPKAFDVADPLEADQLELAELWHQERAPYNLALLQKAGLRVALTTDQLKDKAEFWPNLRKAVRAGLTEAQALAALTTTPAAMLNMQADCGSLEAGRWASFVIADKSLFVKEGQILETWVAGERFIAQDAFAPRLAGTYRFALGADSGHTLTVSATGEFSLRRAGVAADTANRKLQANREGQYLTLSGKLWLDTTGATRLGGIVRPEGLLQGIATLPNGRSLAWTARRTTPLPEAPDTARFKPLPALPASFTTGPYQPAQLPMAGTVLIENATVWTNEAEGKLDQASVLIQNGRIAAVGKTVTAPAGARRIDGRGMHLTPGIVDEHSHIAISGGVNECTHAVTAEVRIGDVVDPEDVNIYRHLAGGVVAAQQLHGSCNVIGGQSSLIKMRWGSPAQAMRITGADGFIKCALGENVKQSNAGDGYRIRYPQTRMGVEQTFKDAFARARAYKAGQQAYQALPAAQKKLRPAPARDYQLEAVNEILDRRRFITCHSYVASEILMLMRLADSAGFKINTFTHILEGYKVADRLKAHGAGASTFADWWYYKMEVQDAIPYNAALLHGVGITTAINSDDAEMARRLNQEAAKAVRYGGVDEQEALKMVTLNPAKLLHLDKEMGSIKAGKSADIVLWTAHPFAPGAKAARTFVDGRELFSLEQDQALRTQITTEKQRLIRLQQEQKAGGAPTQPGGPPRPKRLWGCDDSQSWDECWGG